MAAISAVIMLLDKGDHLILNLMCMVELIVPQRKYLHVMASMLIS